MDEIQAFDPKQDYSVVWRQLPHWAQSGAVSFVTWRTADSMPESAIQRWLRERNDYLSRELTDEPAKLTWQEMSKQIHCWDAQLDACHGACLLRRPELAQIVADSLRKFDGDRYVLTDFVVMPNHVHLLVAFRDEASLLRQCAGWKRYTARQINQLTGRRGAFWQEDSFDHLVRSPEYFAYYRRYIAENGRQAGLRADEYLWYSSA